MKTLKSPVFKLSEDGKQITITAQVSDEPFNNMLVTRVTHAHVHPENPLHVRHVQSSNEAVFCRGGRGFAIAIPNDFIVALAASVEPLTSFAPVFKRTSKPGAVEVISELPVTYQWQISDDPAPTGTYPPPEAKWEDIPNANSATLDENLAPDGKWIRCAAKNAVGTAITKHAQKLTDKK